MNSSPYYRHDYGKLLSACPYSRRILNDLTRAETSHEFIHAPVRYPATRLPLACLWGFGLAACGGESSDALLDQAKPSIARRDTKAAINQLNNAVVVDENNAEARQRFKWMQVTSSTITPLRLP